jgi:hypothetical protein
MYLTKPQVNNDLMEARKKYADYLAKNPQKQTEE